jgi:uncharacterized protein YgiM (DUF1202 family)
MKALFRVPILLVILVLVLGLMGGAASASDLEQQAVFQAPLLVVNTSFLNVRTGPGVQYTVLVTVVGGTELPVLGRHADGVWYQVNTDGGPGWVNIEFTLPRGDFSNIPLLEVGESGAPNVDLGSLGQGGGFAPPPTTSGSGRVQGVSLIGRDLRAQPDFNALVLSRSVPNDPNTILPLLGITTGTDGTVWYNVNVPNIGVGWMDGVALRVLECAGLSVGVTTSQTPITFDGISTRDSYLLDLGTEGYILGFTGVNNSFYRFELVDGTVGLVHTSAVGRRQGVNNVCTGLPNVSANPGQGGGGNAADATSGTRVTIPVIAANTVIVNTGFLNLRSGPSAGYSVVATVAGGTELIVLGRATDNVWFLVQGDFGQGWLNSQFVLFRGDYSTVTVITELIIVTNTGNPGQGGGAPAPNPSTIASGRNVTGVSLIGRNLHQDPSYESLTLSSSIPNDPNVIYPLLATQEVNGTIWYLVDVPNVGRGWMDGVVLRILQCGNDQVGIAVDQTPITFDGISNQQSFIINFGTEFYIVGRKGDFAIIELVDGTTGFFRAASVGQRTGVSNVCTGVSTVVGGNSGTGTTTGTTTGSVTVAPITGNHVVINTGNLNVRSGPSAAFSTVATVPGGTELAVIGRAPDGVWYYVEGAFGRGWVNNQFVLFRGDFATVPVLDITGN